MLEYIDKAISYDNINPFYKSKKAVLLTKLKHFHKAIEMHDQAIKLDSGESLFFKRLGDTYKYMEDDRNNRIVRIEFNKNSIKSLFNLIIIHF